MYVCVCVCVCVHTCVTQSCPQNDYVRGDGRVVEEKMERGTFCMRPPPRCLSPTTMASLIATHRPVVIGATPSLGGGGVGDDKGGRDGFSLRETDNGGRTWVSGKKTRKRGYV